MSEPKWWWPLANWWVVHKPGWLISYQLYRDLRVGRCRSLKQALWAPAGLPELEVTVSVVDVREDG